VKVIAESMARTEAERQRAYRQSNPEAYRKRNATRMRRNRAGALPEFIGVDGEGVWEGDSQLYVLLGVGDKQYENPRGIQWYEAFEFLYEQFKEHPRASFVGFYLRYDFDKILSTLPRHAAEMLFTKEGKAKRMKQDKRNQRMQMFPVRTDRWEMDMLGMKRLSIRPRPDGCNCFELKTKCTHKQNPWMHICDVGPFYQMGFIKVIDPFMWKDDPDGAVCTMEQFKRIEKGKQGRGKDVLDNDMRAYNAEENLLLAVVMQRLAMGFHKVGIHPAKDQWYGPGATASKWLDKQDNPKKKALQIKDGKKPPLIPKWAWQAYKNSYYGGWFEIFSHGLILGTSYNYDINNAYPFATTKLPHLCRECEFTRGKGNARGHSDYLLRYATIYSKDTRIGAMPYRNKQGNILRPAVTKGWYWDFEIEASRRAGLVKRVVTHEWVSFNPCSHESPFTDIRDLYYQRLKVGKSSAQGMAIKLNNNSIYGKFAQSVGSAPYNNWFYASYITAHCRAQILDSIATHPGKTSAVLMVATDGICFDSPHPDLPISKDLGEWERSEYTDLCLFKPGVYWHREGRQALLKVKSRGVPKDEFIKEIDAVQAKFQRYLDIKGYPGWDAPSVIDGYESFQLWVSRDKWPHFIVHVNFRMKSCIQALHEGNWDDAGKVMEKVPVGQDSWPGNKRFIGPYREFPDGTGRLYHGVYFNHDKNRIDSMIYTLEADEIQTFYHKQIKMPPHEDLGTGLEGDARAPMLEGFKVLRDKEFSYEFDMDNSEWELIIG
jgi:hypothetical protein